MNEVQWPKLEDLMTDEQKAILARWRKARDLLTVAGTLVALAVSKGERDAGTSNRATMMAAARHSISWS